MRTPRTRPDLRLAESYIPAVVALIKGLLYVTACLLIPIFLGWQYAYIPLIALYYDHLIFTSSFIDSTSITTDVVASTMAIQTNSLDSSCYSWICWIITFFWCVLGIHHIYTRDAFNHNNNVSGSYLIPKPLAHSMVTCFIVTIFWVANNNSISNSKGTLQIINNSSANNNNKATIIANSGTLLPFYVRTIAYLSLFIVDAYNLRPPLQREKDRIGMLRYGSVLFSPVFMCLLYTAILICTQIACIYQHQQRIEPLPTNANVARDSNLYHTNNNNILHACNQTTSSSVSNINNCINTKNINSVDSLDVQEAFRLAKLQYLDGKASV